MTGHKGSELSATARQWQRVGPLVRAGRLERGWTVAELASRVARTAEQIERLEQGLGIEPAGALEQIARELALDPSTLLQRQHEQPAAEPFDEILEQLAIPRDTWHEFSQLSPAARHALSGVLQRHNRDNSERLRLVSQLLESTRRAGVAASLPALARAIRRYGSGPIDLSRALVTHEELGGPHSLLTDRVPMVPLAQGIDQIARFRSVFGIEPAEPQLVAYWARARRTALQAQLWREEVRVILPLAQLERYARTGERAPHVTASPSIVREHVATLVGLLRRNRRFRVGLVDEVPLVGMRIKRQDLILCGSGDLTPRDGQTGVMLRFSDSPTIDLFQGYFDGLWESIPAERRDPNAIADRLDAIVAEHSG